MDLGAYLGAKIYGAEVLPRQFLPWFGFLPIHAKKNCADVLYLGANNNDAEPKIYFLNEIVK
jgi:hypothetical protein